ncbi:MAG: hypothetical protein RIS70_2465 [Planctomycetota bacterium]
MSTFGSHPIEMILIAMLSGGLGMPPSIPPLPEDELIARIAPQECLVFMNWAGTAEPNPTRDHATEKMLRDPRVQAYLRQLELQQAAIFPPTRDGTNPEAVLRFLLHRPTGLFLSKLKLDAQGLSEIEGGLVINLGDKAQEAAATLASLKETLVDVEPITIGGNLYLRKRFSPVLPVVTWGLRGSHFIAGIGEGVVEAIEQRIDQDPPDWLAGMRQRCAVPRFSGSTYVQMAKLLRNLDAVDSPVHTLGALAGLDRIASIGSVSGMDETGCISRTEIAFAGDSADKSLWRNQPPLTAADLNNIPAQSPAALVFRMDADRTYEWATSVWAQFNPFAKQQFDEQITYLEQQYRFDFRQDFLRSTGSSWRIYAEPGAAALLNGWTLAIPVKDRAKLSRVYDLIMQSIQATAAQGNGPPVRTTTSGRYTIYSLGDLFFYPTAPVSFSACLTDKELFVSFSLKALQGTLGRTVTSPSLAATPAVERLLKSDSPPLAILHVNLKQCGQTILTFLDREMRQAQAARENASDAAGTSQPPIDAMTEYLEPSLITVLRTKSGIELQSRQTVPGMAMGLSAPASITSMLPFLQSARGSARNTQSMNNIKQLILALHNFHDSYGHFPAAYQLTKEGKPGLSWRVFMLPFLDQQALFEQFHLEEPWDSEHNKQLIAKMPDVFRSPGSKADAGKTTYLGNAGESGLFAKPKKGQTKSPPPGIGINQITDGTSNTAAMIEVSDERAVIWTKPDDFEPDPKDFLRGVVDAASQTFHLGLADGSVRTMSKKTPQDLLKAIFSRNGGETIQLP